MKNNKNIVISLIAIVVFSLCAYSLTAQSKEISPTNNQIASFYPIKDSPSMGEKKAFWEKVEEEKTKKILVILTAYSSTADQTDDSPFMTANGTFVRDGIVANNMLPFGTKIKIPEFYGDKEFVVADRMNARVGHYIIDIWFPSREAAKNFGVKKTYIEVSES
jgi:3D (Asp-Asp-Asp) domain-containing protein